MMKNPYPKKTAKEIQPKKIKICGCGKYKPRSTKGIIDYSCKNCGGKISIQII